MIFRQLFDHDSYTYTYLIADDKNKEALLIDPVLEHADNYITLITQLGLRLKTTLETHTHADHITASGVLRSKTGCMTMVAQQSHAHCAAGHFKDGDSISVGQYQLKAMYTPGHTDDSFCFYVDSGQRCVFTGDTLLIRGCGRTDFQNGNAHDQYNSLQKLLKLPPETLVYPGHDYKGWSVSTIAEEKQHNPRLQAADEMAFVRLMQNLKLDNPKMMDVAVPANQACGNVRSN